MITPPVPPVPMHCSAAEATILINYVSRWRKRNQPKAQATDWWYSITNLVLDYPDEPYNIRWHPNISRIIQMNHETSQSHFAGTLIHKYIYPDM